MMLKYLIQTSIFRYSKNYGSLTLETRIKDAVNMGDLICLLATVRTLNEINKSVSPCIITYLMWLPGTSRQHLYYVNKKTVLHTTPDVSIGQAHSLPPYIPCLPVTPGRSLARRMHCSLSTLHLCSQVDGKSLWRQLHPIPRHKWFPQTPAWNISTRPSLDVKPPIKRTLLDGALFAKMHN